MDPGYVADNIDLRIEGPDDAPNVLVVPGMMQSVDRPWEVAKELYPGSRLVGYQHPLEDKRHMIKLAREATFQDEMDALVSVADLTDGTFDIVAESHGFLVAGICCLEGLIDPVGMIGISPMFSRRDWLDIRNGKTDSFEPYASDPVLRGSRVDFSGDTRFDMYGLDIPMIVVHGTADAYFYDEDGAQRGSNNVDRLRVEPPKQIIIEAEGEPHVLSEESLREAMIKIRRHMEG